MLRRDVVRVLVAVCAAPRMLFSQQGKAPLPLAAPVPWTLGLDGKTHLPKVREAELVAEADLTFFTKPQMATMVRLSEVLMPPVGDKPGAVQAETPAFMDFFVGKSPANVKKMYTGGLVWLDAEAMKKFKMPFAKLSDEQAGMVLKPWLRTWMTDHPPTEMHADFVNIVHDDIRTATVNSKAWSDTASSQSQQRTAVSLYWSPIEPDMASVSAAGAKIQPHVLAVPKTSHPMPSYPR